MLRYISKVLTVFAASMAVSCSGTAKSVSGTPLPEYHGLYTPSNTKELQEALHTNHPDYDWGLWGHNLVKAIQGGNGEDMYAVIGGKRTKDQLCFSSPALYEAVRSYIIDQFGYGDENYSERITIMPMDNTLACTCPRCRKLGNTEGNATPAVTYFITKLAREFPRHQFFTSAYHSTMKAPSTILPSNVGVFISSFPLPVQVDFTKSKGYLSFVSTVQAWRGKCSRIYIWDYERNFDDYLSPFPCLLAMQSRLRLYERLGLRGVFFNGSGDDQLLAGPHCDALGDEQPCEAIHLGREPLDGKLALACGHGCAHLCPPHMKTGHLGPVCVRGAGDGIRTRA